MMRSCFILLMICFAHDVMAQKPGRGSYTAEAQTGLIFSGFGSFTQNQIRVRHYLDSNWAVFVGPEFTINSFERVVFENPQGTGQTGLYRNTNKNVFLNMGVMRFFNMNQHLAPYFGIQYGFGNQQYKTTTTDCNSSGGFQLNLDTESTNLSRQHQLALLTGADYWFKSGFCIGFQLSISGQYIKTKTAKSVINNNGFVTVTKIQPTTSMNLNSASTTGLRVGWRFN